MDERTLTFVGGTMLKRRSPLAACLLLLVFAAARGQAADDPAVPESAVKAIKYHTLLAKRPEPGFLFDRFYNTWLDESTVDSLEAFCSNV